MALLSTRKGAAALPSQLWQPATSPDVTIEYLSEGVGKVSTDTLLERFAERSGKMSSFYTLWLRACDLSCQISTLPLEPGSVLDGIWQFSLQSEKHRFRSWVAFSPALSTNSASRSFCMLSVLFHFLLPLWLATGPADSVGGVSIPSLKSGFH